MQQIRLTPSEWSALNAELEQGPAGKIPAIKIARNAKAHQITDPHSGRVSSRIGLKEAKEAVEFYMTSIGYPSADGSLPWTGGEPSARLVPFQPIKRIVVDMGGGEVEVDMEEMSLRFLSTMTTLRISDVQRLVDLWQRVRDWEESQ